MGLRLNLACGDTLWDGFDNSDINGHPGVRYLDLEEFPYPYKCGSAELILMSHALQMTHVTAAGREPVHPDHGRILRELSRILEPGGWLRIDDNPLRFPHPTDRIPEDGRAAEAGRGFPDELRIPRQQLVDTLFKAGFRTVCQLDPDETTIPAEGTVRAAIVGNHRGHLSFALEASK